MKLKDRPKTIVLDIDGCLIKHIGDVTKQSTCTPEVLPGVIQKLKEWDLKGHRLVLLTGRKESCRKQTEEQLARVGIHYDALVMGATSGERVLVNDRKPNSSEDTARGISVDRNKGFVDLDI